MKWEHFYVSFLHNFLFLQEEKKGPVEEKKGPVEEKKGPVEEKKDATDVNKAAVAAEEVPENTEIQKCFLSDTHIQNGTLRDKFMHYFEIIYFLFL